MSASEFTARLLGKPSVDTGSCAICGRPGGDLHHVVQKGIGGVSRGTERLIPKMRLCGFGNASGHHGMLHGGLLHVYWDDRREWVYYISAEPVNDAECWRANKDKYIPVPGWEELKNPPVTYGRRR